MTTFRAWKTRRRAYWRRLPLYGRIVVVLGLLTSDWTLYASGEYQRLHGVAGGFIAGFWGVVTMAAIVVIVAIVREVR